MDEKAKNEICQACDGTGWHECDMPDMQKKCNDCGGSGYVAKVRACLPNPTPDAVALAFREMADADPELVHPLPISKQACCRPMFTSMFGEPFNHAPDCPWLRRKQARERAEKAWKEDRARLLGLLHALVYPQNLSADDVRLLVMGQNGTLESKRLALRMADEFEEAQNNALAALKGAPTT